jgi:hypothetical protein
VETDDLTQGLLCLFSELVHGAPEAGAFVLNPRDRGLLASLDELSAADASASSNGGATIAAHAAHLAYGLSLLNRWAAGENPYGDADWSEAWRVGRVTADEWSDIRRRLRDAAQRWHDVLGSDRNVAGTELNGVLASIAHIAYHLGAMRQIHAALRGPKDDAT